MAAEIIPKSKDGEQEGPSAVTNVENSEFKRIDSPEESKPEEKQGNIKILNFLKSLTFAGEKTSKLNRALILFQSNSITLRNLIVAASTYGLEQLLNAKAFNCPAENYKQYGYAFLFAPPVILFCLNLLVLGEIWKLSSRMCIKRYRRRGDCLTRVLSSLLKACVGPAVWLIAAFQDEDYYLCANLGPSASRGNRTGQQRVVECQSQSQVLSWGILVAIVILGTALVMWKRCYLKNNILMENLYAYERREALSARKAFTEHMGGSLKDANLDNDPMTSEHGSKEEKVTLYNDGIPEMIGKKTVEKLFEGYSGDKWTSDDDWYYIRAYKDFKKMYPRISTGSPLDPWRMVKGDAHKKSSDSTSPWDELKPLQPIAATRQMEKPSELDDIRESMV